MSEIQQELMDMSNRYDLAGDRLSDRKHDLSQTLEKVKSYLEDMQKVLTWLEEKESNLVPLVSLPVTADEAEAKLAEHMVSS